MEIGSEFQELRISKQSKEKTLMFWRDKTDLYLCAI